MSKSTQSLLEVHPHGHFSALIADIFMPNMNGHELCDYVAANDPELPIVVISGYHPEEFERKDRRHFAFLAKPVLPAKLCETVETIIHTP